MNRVQLSGHINSKVDADIIWLETIDRSFVLTSVPKAYQEGMALLEHGDEISIEGTLFMSPVSSSSSSKPVAQGSVAATRMEAIRPSNRAKRVNRMWHSLNRARDRFERDSEEFTTQMDALRNEAYQLKHDKQTAEANTISVRKEAQEAILRLIAGGTT